MRIMNTSTAKLLTAAAIFAAATPVALAARTIPCAGEIFPWPTEYQNKTLCVPALNVPLGNGAHISYFTEWRPINSTDEFSPLVLVTAFQYSSEIKSNAISDPVYFNQYTGELKVYRVDHNWMIDTYKLINGDPLTIKKQSPADEFLDELLQILGQ